MKKLIQCIAFLSFISVNAQGFRSFNQFSVEAVYGMSIPVSTVSEISDDSYSSTAHFGFGVRYMFNEDWGVKGQLAIDQFRGDIEETGTDFVGVDLQAYYNLGRLLEIPLMTRERVGLLAHSGFGVGYSKSIQEDLRERVGQYMVGLTPIFGVSDVVTVTLDFTYTFNFRQHFNFDGEFAKPDRDYTTGGFFTPSLGIVIYLGSERRHADWY
ncbi:hypothetical protein [Flavobacterium sp.]|jgi:OOP family OmpA-OmpF porin|uniref:hypothetical protein n=1 Tax=Flavobacterium sp. TaxID=239 RepID=UPI0037C005C9